MVKCPNCGEEIEFLEYSEEKTYDAIFSLVDGKPNYDTEGYSISGNTYTCPRCDQVMARDEEAAITFLKGGE